ncbi:uncharacterized protein BDR25DRAFT_232874 [Lindgomyces ingoldianus]|uniref:Uncharacterized protein n=1 Tax=Lindgomyces ingoldianus TaxID=673940 RepID=A0ACB6QMA6_9PLEO|nr:uncharacterized protein BDR25DRAFT_232874 [Lindgomyces ingoldianus]KAF2468118.1 hypothetical protein BDR25DRAFT_232874 [Lindgomyces ingoldianus]
MPLLKDLDCSIELGDSREKLQEYGTSYGDGFVESFIRVPSDPKTFAVRLTSSGFIAPGLAMFVYIDGIYQCNRNRLGLVDPQGAPGKLGKRTVVNFHVRQKEERQQNGSLIAREWAFAKLNTGRCI